MTRDHNAPGQRYRTDFPRFGLDQYAERIVKLDGPWTMSVGGDVACEITLDAEALAAVSRVEQVSDFHCVTTWSHADLRWGGYRFRDVWNDVIAPRVQPFEGAHWLIARAHDGARTNLLMEDALADDVLLADTLNGEPLSVEHGAPLRLVAPRHYGFKNIKHLKRLELWRDLRHFKRSVPFALMDHPRGRVALEERGTLPGWLLRMLYRPLVDRTVKRFQRAWDRAHSPPSATLPTGRTRTTEA